MPKLLSQANFSNITVTSLTTTSDSQAVLDVFSKESYRSAKSSRSKARRRQRANGDLAAAAHPPALDTT